jgi:pilus assembly protein CpaC
MRFANFTPVLRAFAAALLAAGVVAGGPVQAAVRAIAAGADSLEIEVNKGALVRLPAAAAAVFVADPRYADIAVKSPTLIYVTAKRTGETSLFAVDENDQLLANVNLHITHNLNALRLALRDLVPDAAIEVRSIKGGIVLAGSVANAVQARNALDLANRYLAEKEQVVNQMQVVGSSQVNLRVRVAEVKRNALKTLGFNFDIIGTVGNFGFGLFKGRDFLNTARTVVTPLSDGSTSVFGQYANSNVDATAMIDALDNEGIITILAEPNLTAISGETAHFLAGGEFPIPVSDADGAITIEFKSFGIELAFTPVVLGADRISLKVAPEVSALSTQGQVNLNGFLVPSLETRRANTTVELASGQSFAIAGLLRRDTLQSLNGTPGAASLPIIGALFRSTQFQNDETELAIIVTPYLVQPVSTRLATPLDGFQVPSDNDRIVKGQMQRNVSPVPAAPQSTSAIPAQSSVAGFELN